MRESTVRCDAHCRSPRCLFVVSVFVGGVLPTLPSIALGDTIAVPGDCPTIQLGIDAAEDGHEVVVAPGVYFENIDFTGKDITVRSLDPTDPSVVESTIIDGQSLASVVTMDRGTIAGFSIRNGVAQAPDFSGGGVYLKYALGQDAEIAHNVITDCVATHGGGLRVVTGGADAIRIVRNSILTDNSAWGGGWTSGHTNSASETSSAIGTSMCLILRVGPTVSPGLRTGRS